MTTLAKTEQTLQPSRVARYVAGKEWGIPVQDQQMLARGIYNFSTPGHGGIVAVIGYAPSLTDEAIQAARDTGYTCQVAVWTRRYRNEWFYSCDYAAESWADFIERNPSLEIYDVWVGEEDCACKTILGVSEPARLGTSKRMINPDAWNAKFDRAYFRQAGYEQEQRFFARLAELEA